jgi:hypothetical protein
VIGDWYHRMHVDVFRLFSCFIFVCKGCRYKYSIDVLYMDCCAINCDVIWWIEQVPSKGSDKSLDNMLMQSNPILESFGMPWQT